MLILASESRTRKALLAGAGLAFEAHSAGVNEREIEAAAVMNGATPVLVAQELAEAKALAIEGAVVIGADQVLALDGELLHKTEDLEGARRQLDRLRGRTHHLHAAVALARDGRVVWSAVETAELTMREFSDVERDHVLALEGDGGPRQRRRLSYRGAVDPPVRTDRGRLLHDPRPAASAAARGTAGCMPRRILS